MKPFTSNNHSPKTNSGGYIMKKKLIFAVLIVSILFSLFTTSSLGYESSYKVNKGDTLYKISRQYGTSVKELAEYNQIKNPNLIYPGQVVKIPQKDLDYNALYIDAVKDAMIADELEISNDLIAITSDNTYIKWDDKKEKVLVVSWTKYPSSYENKTEVVTSWGETWVTVAPQLLDWYKNTGEDVDNKVLRTEQLLGLPKDSKYTSFIELWVSPADLFRPSADNEVTDSTVKLDLPTDVTQDYITWYNGQIIYSYFPYKFPWTRLGYTYDWGNPDNEVGLSEFVIRKGSHVIVKNIYTTEEYLGN